LAAVVWIGAAGLIGCTTTEPVARVPALTVVADRSEDMRSRVLAVSEARAEAGDDAEMLGATQRVFRDIAWTQGEPPRLRVAVLHSMMNDPDAGVVREARETAKLLLPREQAREVVAYLSGVAADRGWDEFVPALIRSYARSMAGVDDAQRWERVAITRLAPGKPVEQTVFEVFLRPPAMASTYGIDWEQRCRADAWDLLARIDQDGATRMKLMAQAGDGAQGTSGDEAVALIRRCVRELHAIPLTGEELRWVTSLAEGADVKNARWWAEAASAIAGLTDKGPLSVRHAEAIRWASQAQPAWLLASREDLLGELRGLLKGKDHNARSAEAREYRVADSLSAWESKLRWGDVLTMLVVLRALPDVGPVLAAQAQMDRKDTSTEYGGVLTQREGVSEKVWVATLYPPRPGQRQGDQRFIASDDMVKASDRALAHYHFHAQRVRNSEYAGPSPGDLAYAARSGRACLVLTSIGDGVLGVDYYQPDGVVVDLGSMAVGFQP